MTDDWKWEIINEWGNTTPGYRPDDNIVQITAYVKRKDIFKEPPCMAFLVHRAEYQNERKPTTQ